LEETLAFGGLKTTARRGLGQRGLNFKVMFLKEEAEEPAWERGVWANKRLGTKEGRSMHQRGSRR